MGNGVQTYDLSPRQLQLIQRTVAADCSAEEFNLFIEAAKHYRLDPFRRQIMPLVFSKSDAAKRRMSIVVGIDGQRILAQRCGNYRPASEPPEYELDETLKGPANPLGIVVCRTKLWQQDNLGEWFPVAGEAYWEEFAPIRNLGDEDAYEWIETGEKWPDSGKPKMRKKLKAGASTQRGLDPGTTWPKMPRLLILKCATMQALRAGWPDEFGGVYAEEEMDKAKAIDLDASEAVEKQAEQDRLNRVAHRDTIAVTWGGVWGIDYVPLGEFADRVIEWLQEKDRAPEEVSAFRSVNRVGLQEFWARAPGDALELKRKLEAAENQPPLRDGPALLRHQLTESVKLGEREAVA